MRFYPDHVGRPQFLDTDDVVVLCNRTKDFVHVTALRVLNTPMDACHFQTLFPIVLCLAPQVLPFKVKLPESAKRQMQNRLLTFLPESSAESILESSLAYGTYREVLFPGK